MGFSPLIKVGFLLVMSAATAALDIQPETGGVVRTGWIRYEKSNNRLPQCCDPASVDCSMVRIQAQLIQAAKTSKQLRFTMSDIQGDLNLIVSYDDKLDGLVGKVYKSGGDDAGVYTIRPTSLTQRKTEPCYVGRLSSSMNSYHTLTRVSDEDVGAPKVFFKASDDKPRERSCCYGIFCHGVSDFNLNALKGLASGSYDLYVPRQDFPSADDSEMFAQTATEGCSATSSLCDVYFYKNANDETLRILVNGNTVVRVAIDANPGAPNLILEKCNGGEYIWSESPNQKRYGGPQPDNLPIEIGASGRADPGPACWFQEDYCDTLHYSVRWYIMDKTGKTTDQLIMECYDYYQQHNDQSEYFTYLYMRDRAECHLLSDCFKKNDDICIEKRTCVSGPVECGPLPDNANCTSPPDLGPEFNKWQCIDKKTNKLGPVQPLDDLLPGTICLQSCGAWRALPKAGQPQRTGYLESTCQNDGDWSQTTTISGDGVLEFPAGPYPLPDSGLSDSPLPLSCGCEDLPLLYDGEIYNPNDEEGADFACEQPLDTSGLITIQTGNTCYLWCDGVLAITVTCTEDGWTGSPTLGVWCYEPPATQGTPPTPPTTPPPTPPAKQWVKIFSHDSTGGFFNSFKSFKWSNGGDPDAKKFSIMGKLLNQAKKIKGDDNKFHFKICYPERTDISGEPCNEWKQSSNPMTTVKSKIEGYETVKLAFEYRKGGNEPFEGIAKNKKAYLKKAWIDATPNHLVRWYAIGARQKYDDSCDSCIPGPQPDAGVNITKVELWVFTDYGF